MSAGTIILVEDEGVVALHLMEVLTNPGYIVTDLIISGEDLLSVGKTGLVVSEVQESLKYSAYGFKTNKMPGAEYFWDKKQRKK